MAAGRRGSLTVGIAQLPLAAVPRPKVQDGSPTVGEKGDGVVYEERYGTSVERDW